MTIRQHAHTLAIILVCSLGMGNSSANADDVGAATEDAIRSLTDTSDAFSTESAGGSNPCAGITPDSSKKAKAACKKYQETHPQQ